MAQEGELRTLLQAVLEEIVGPVVEHRLPPLIRLEHPLGMALLLEVSTPYYIGKVDADANHHIAPAWGGVSGGRTPAWKNDGSRTANPYEGNRTAYGGVGSRTPSWTSGSKTPYDSSSGFDAFASGSRTPGWNAGAANAGGRTPGWNTMSAGRDQRDFEDAPTPGGNYSAPTPGAYAAPTPGAPTPGGWPESAPTPGGAFSAPTPGGPSKRDYDAPTPAAFDAPTPAMGGMAATPGAGYGGNDGGPRYDDSPSP